VKTSIGTSDALDRLGQLDLAAVDAHPANAPDLVGDVRRRDGPEKRAGRAGLDLEPQHCLAEQLRDLARVLDAPRLVAGALGIALLELGDLRRRRHLGQPARQEEIPRVPARDVHDLATQADLVDVLGQDDLHPRYPLT